MDDWCKRGSVISFVLAAGIALGGCALSAEDIEEQTSHARAVAAKAREMAEQQVENKGAPGYDEPGYDEPGYDEPGYDAPGYGTAGYGPSVYDEPLYGAPGYGPSVYDEPLYGAPGYGAGAPVVSVPVVGGPAVGGPLVGAPVLIERGPGYVIVESCDAWGNCVRRTETVSGYGYRRGYYGTYGSACDPYYGCGY